MNITRASIANITPEGIAQKIAEHNRDFPTLGISASITANIGVTPDWGIESGVTIETTATWDIFALFLREVLSDLREKCTFITCSDSKAFLMYSDGTVEGVK